MCEAKGIKKPRTIDTFKRALVCKWLEDATTAEIAQVISLAGTSSAPELTAPSASSVVPASSSAVPAADAAANAAGASVLSQLVPVTEDFDDETAFFADIREGPPLEDNLEPSMKDLISQGEDGLLPLAGLVKILQALQEMEPLVQVAVLFAQETTMTTAKLKRALVRRIMMGTTQQCQDFFEEELRRYPHLYVWGIIAEKDNHMLIQAEENNGFPDNFKDATRPLYIGILTPENLPTDLSKSRNWLVADFLSFRDNAEVWLCC